MGAVGTLGPSARVVVTRVRGTSTASASAATSMTKRGNGRMQTQYGSNAQWRSSLGGISQAANLALGMTNRWPMVGSQVPNGLLERPSFSAKRM